jgi:hypothetical protein
MTIHVEAGPLLALAAGVEMARPRREGPVTW